GHPVPDPPLLPRQTRARRHPRGRRLGDRGAVQLAGVLRADRNAPELPASGGEPADVRGAVAPAAQDRRDDRPGAAAEPHHPPV
ncbi:MAG: hypothetical protein AVDCRST_MAG83-1132, partial [uncultured Arthrobacter sp.]